MDLTLEERYNLVTRNLAEIVGETDVIKAIMKVRPLKIYFGTAPTGKIHLGYFVPLLKIADYLQANCEVTILIADLHAFLDNMKSSLKLLELRTKYYEEMIKAILTSLNIDINKLRFVKGTDYQLSKEYTMDVYKLNSITTLHEAKHAGAEVVKQSDNPMMTGLLYPGLQALDEQYLDVDTQSGGIDQRKIFMYSRKNLPKIGYKKRIHFMTEMVPGLRFVKKEIIEKKDETKVLEDIKQQVLNIVNNNASKDSMFDSLKTFIELNEVDDSNVQLEKMSASNEDSKIDLLDTKNQIKKKINKAYCFPGDAEDNSLMTLLEKIIFPLLEYKKEIFTINRPEQFGGVLTYDTFEKVKEAFQKEELHPADFKLGIIDMLNGIIEPIRKKFEEKELKNLVSNAYK